MNRGASFLGLIVTFGSVHALLLAVVAREPWAAAALAGALGLRLLVGGAILRAMGLSCLLRLLALLPLRDLLTAAVWAVSLLGREVVWRGRRLRVAPGGLLEPLPTRPALPGGRPAAAGTRPEAR